MGIPIVIFDSAHFRREIFPTPSSRQSKSGGQSAPIRLKNELVVHKDDTYKIVGQIVLFSFHVQKKTFFSREIFQKSRRFRAWRTQCQRDPHCKRPFGEGLREISRLQRVARAKVGVKLLRLG